MIAFRHADPRFPFLWEQEDQPAARWNGEGEGPVQYLADTPDGAWAEFLRHEEIREVTDLATIRRAIWAVEIDDDETTTLPGLPNEILTGGRDTYSTCQDEARRLRLEGATKLVAPSAALGEGDARGWRVDGGVTPGYDRDGKVNVLFGSRPTVVGWQVVSEGRPSEEILEKVRYFQ